MGPATFVCGNMEYSRRCTPVASHGEEFPLSSSFYHNSNRVGSTKLEDLLAGVLLAIQILPVLERFGPIC